MVRIVLIHPGTTDYDEQKRIQGTLDIPLNDHGAQEVKRMIEDLRPLNITAIYCGPCQSCCETAEAISEALGAKLKTLETLKNIDHGLWQGMLREDVKRKHPKVYRGWQEQPSTVCPPEGEMLSTAQERVQSALAKILKKNKDGTIAIVAPEPLASVVHGYLLQQEVGDMWKGGEVCGKWEAITLEPQSLVPTES